MRTWIALLALTVLCPSAALATAQFGDRLLYKGQEYSIHTNPLEMYFDEAHPRPDGLFQASCTACWRGYLATWEIKDDGFLYLVKLIEGTCAGDAPEIPLEKVFPGQTGPIKATWFTGMLKAPHGEMLHYVHMGYQSRYEKELHIFIREGKVEREETIDNRPKELEGKDKKIKDVKGRKDGSGKDKKKDGDGEDKNKDGNGEDKKKDGDGEDNKKDGNGKGEKSSPRKPRIPVA